MMRQKSFDTCGVIALTVWSWPLLRACPVEGLQEAREPEQVGAPERGQPGPEHHRRVGRDDIRPRRRQRAQLIALVEEPDAILAPVVPKIEEFVLPTAPGMEWVGDPEKSLPFGATGCN